MMCSLMACSKCSWLGDVGEKGKGGGGVGGGVRPTKEGSCTRDKTSDDVGSSSSVTTAEGGVVV